MFVKSNQKEETPERQGASSVDDFEEYGDLDDMEDFDDELIEESDDGAKIIPFPNSPEEINP